MATKIMKIKFNTKKKMLFLLFFARILDKFLTLGRKMYYFCSRLIEFFVPLASPKVLSLGNEKKSLLFFCISLAYAYLCTNELR